VTTLAVTLVLLWRSWGDGVILFRDDVQVPDPAWNDALLGAGAGPPRAVPFSTVSYLLTELVGASVSQSVLLAAPLVLAGTGVAVLLRRHGVAATCVGALVAVWNPYVAERLGLGQSPTMLAYGALPWLLVATAVRGPAWRVAARSTLAFVPAAMTPVGAVLGLGTLAVGLAARRPPRRVAILALAGPVLLCGPWVVAGLVASVAVAEPAGAAAYAVRADSPWGVLASVATLGGVWSSAAAPPSRGDVLTTVSAMLLVTAAAAGWAVHGRVRWLALGWLVPVVVVLAAATPWAVDGLADLQRVPGVALLRDTHRLLAPAAVAVALGVGLLVGRIASPGAVRVAGALLAAACCLTTVPDLPATLAEHYRPVVPPSDWRAALRLVEAEPGGVLSLPWQPLRRTSWNDDRPFLDPVPLAAAGTTVSSTRLQVRRDGRLLVTDLDAVPPSSGWPEGVVRRGDLASRGISWVVEDRASPGRPVVAEGLTLVLDGPTVRVWRVPGSVSPSPQVGSPTAVAVALAAAAATVLAAALAQLLGRRRRAVRSLP
jgi:hypothetical protein